MTHLQHRGLRQHILDLWFILEVVNFAILILDIWGLAEGKDFQEILKITLILRALRTLRIAQKIECKITVTVNKGLNVRCSLQHAGTRVAVKSMASALCNSINIALICALIWDMFAVAGSYHLKI